MAVGQGAVGWRPGSARWLEVRMGEGADSTERGVAERQAQNGGPSLGISPEKGR